MQLPLPTPVTEQWTFIDINGDGLPDLQWGKGGWINAG
jgi:hypothetical protein